MHRMDSGVDSSDRLKPAKSESSSGQSNTGSARPRRRTQHSTECKVYRIRTDTGPARPACGKKRSRRTDSAEPRRKSIPSSSENSTKSPGHKNGSKPSSRRTSCTLVDPSRPARHYRLNSSPAAPTANSDIDDVLALHFRSCSLFQTATHPSTLSSPSGHGHADRNSGFPFPQIHSDSPPTRTGEDEINTVEKASPPEGAHATEIAIEKIDTTMHWISPGTRRQEYEKMDKANSGIRGLVRKVVPRCVSGPSPRFFDEDKSDVGSVRRYRMDISDEEEEEEVDEKNASLLRHQTRKLEPLKPKTCDTTTKKKRWGCF